MPELVTPPEDLEPCFDCNGDGVDRRDWSECETCAGAGLVCTQTANDRPPNFRDDEGNLFLVRCFSCAPEIGKENYAPNVASGVCTWCGWPEEGK